MTLEKTYNYACKKRQCECQGIVCVCRTIKKTPNYLHRIVILITGKKCSKGLIKGRKIK